MSEILLDVDLTCMRDMPNFDCFLMMLTWFNLYWYKYDIVHMMRGRQCFIVDDDYKDEA